MSDEAIYAAASGAIAQGMRLEVLANNLANIETTGFKEDESIFSNFMPVDDSSNVGVLPEFQTVEGCSPLWPYANTNCQVKFDGTSINHSKGPLSQTGNPFDFAIEGNGFFCVLTGQGEATFTRNGNFTIDSTGKLVTQDGLTVLGDNGQEIVINGKSVSVDDGGVIKADGNDLGALKIVDFDNPYELEKIGSSLFVPSEGSGPGHVASKFKVKQGFIELSNVDPIKAMTEMIEVQRAFETYQKIIRTMDEISSRSINEIGRPV
ncbi:Flagellar basal body rod protein FlgF [uncultured Desulfobacterium sp.]|uniref:Flagellar basal body rod protein FlgF n=1 Tax=uncultured Desulfobacterium sp. TaxID=201089 RepID=A0A445MTA6_9BACT|nr:Flagellar basal body rod protein FlgF [uncultured Desulfobacterium sp.]